MNGESRLFYPANKISTYTEPNQIAIKKAQSLISHTTSVDQISMTDFRLTMLLKCVPVITS